MERPEDVFKRQVQAEHPEAVAKNPGREGLRDRRGVKRWWGPGRGQVGPSVRITKDRVQVDSEGREHQFEFGLAELTAGLPEEAAGVLPDDWVPEVEAAVQTLLSLPCDCGTWTEGSSLRFTRTLSRQQVPNVPVDWSFRADQCTVCGRLWIIERTGDSHYSYSERRSIFQPV